MVTFLKAVIAYDIGNRVQWTAGCPVFLAHAQSYPAMSRMVRIITPSGRTHEVERESVDFSGDQAKAQREFMKVKYPHYILTRESQLVVLRKAVMEENVVTIAEGDYVVKHPYLRLQGHIMETVILVNGSVYPVPRYLFMEAADQQEAYRWFTARMLPGASVPGIDHANPAFGPRF